MSEGTTLADLVELHLKSAKVGESRVATLVNEKVGIPQFLHRSTVRNWRIGTSKRVKDWRQLTAMAMVLHLSYAQTEELLQISGCPSLQELLETVDGGDSKFLQSWSLKDSEPKDSEPKDSQPFVLTSPVPAYEFAGTPTPTPAATPFPIPAPSFPLELLANSTVTSGAMPQSTLTQAFPNSSLAASSLESPKVVSFSSFVLDDEQSSIAVLPLTKFGSTQLIEPSVPRAKNRLIMTGLVVGVLAVFAFMFLKEPVNGQITQFMGAPTNGLVPNGGFESGLTEWAMYVNESALAHFTVIDGSLRAEVMKPGDDDWHVQIFQAQINVDAEKTYLLRFRARSDSPNDFYVDVTRTADPKTSVGISGRSRQRITVSENWESYVVEFIAGETLHADEGGARILFDLGWVKPGAIWLDDVELIVPEKN